MLGYKPNPWHRITRRKDAIQRITEIGIPMMVWFGSDSHWDMTFWFIHDYARVPRWIETLERNLGDFR